jgi:hypothetical protein
MRGAADPSRQTPVAAAKKVCGAAPLVPGHIAGHRIAATANSLMAQRFDA